MTKLLNHISSVMAEFDGLQFTNDGLWVLPAILVAIVLVCVVMYKLENGGLR